MSNSIVADDVKIRCNQVRQYPYNRDSEGVALCDDWFWDSFFVEYYAAVWTRHGVARAIRQGDQCIIDAYETIQGNLFTLCRTLQIRGTVNGDVLGASTDAQITRKVAGDVYLLAGQLEISGEVGEDVHFAGAVLRLTANC